MQDEPFLMGAVIHLIDIDIGTAIESLHHLSVTPPAAFIDGIPIVGTAC